MFRGDRLKNLRIERNMTQLDLANILCVRSNTVSRYEMSDHDPGSETVAKLAELFNVSADYLLGRTPNRKGIPNKIDEQNTVPIPILGVIRAGSPILAIENIEGYVPVTPEEASGGEYFYLRVSGDSMDKARIFNGDLVYVRAQNDVDSRTIAVVVIDGENATLKRVIKTPAGVFLQPESSNPEHMPMFFPEGKGDFRIIGRVMHVKFKVNDI